MKKIKHIITDGSSKVILYAAAVVVVSLTVGITLAYLAAGANRTNTIYIDKGDIGISEAFSEPTTLSLENTTQKEVKVQNKGEKDCYIRVYVDFSDSEIKKRSSVSNEEDKDKDLYVPWSQFASTSQKIAENWEYNADDGYFYYTKKVEKGQYTDTLFRWIKTEFGKQSAGGTSEQYLTSTNSVDFISDFDIIVYSESVQTVDNDGKEVGYEAAWKYFLTKDRT